MKKDWKVLSVGGSIVIPKTGFDIDFLKKFRKLIISRIEKGERFIIVIGGGATCRAYQDAAKAVTDQSSQDLDWLGIHTTIYNAQFVRSLFKDIAYKKVITNPNKKVFTNKSLIIAAGYKPGCSTDKDAVLLAKTYKAKQVFNLSNIDYVFDKDPNKYNDAKKIKDINWSDFQKIVGTEWDPGLSAPFDPIASILAKKLKLKVSIINGTDLTTVSNALSDKKFTGTVIS